MSTRSTLGVLRTPYDLAREKPDWLSAHERELAAKVAAKWFADEEARKQLEYAHKIRLAAEF